MSIPDKTNQGAAIAESPEPMEPAPMERAAVRWMYFDERLDGGKQEQVAEFHGPHAGRDAEDFADWLNAGSPDGDAESEATGDGEAHVASVGPYRAIECWYYIGVASGEGQLCWEAPCPGAPGRYVKCGAKAWGVTAPKVIPKYARWKNSEYRAQKQITEAPNEHT